MYETMLKGVCTEKDPFGLFGQTYNDPRRYFRGKNGDLIIVIACEKKYNSSSEIEIRYTALSRPVGSASRPSPVYGEIVTLEKFLTMIQKEIDISPIKDALQAELDEARKRKSSKPIDPKEDKVWVPGVGYVPRSQAHEYYELWNMYD